MLNQHRYRHHDWTRVCYRVAVTWRSSRTSSPREPLGVAGGADGAVEVQRPLQSPAGGRRIAEHRSQSPPAHLQDTRRQGAPCDRLDQLLGAFECGLDLGARYDAIPQ